MPETLMDEQEFQSYVDSGKYWYIRLDGTEWFHKMMWLSRQLAKRQPGRKYPRMEDKPMISYRTLDDQLIFLLKKKFWPARAIARAFGGNEEHIKKADRLVLHPTEWDHKLPKPTVDYWGTA